MSKRAEYRRQKRTQKQRPKRKIMKKDLWPTHQHNAEHWESLGRLIGTFGCLEWTIGTAISELKNEGGLVGLWLSDRELVKVQNEKIGKIMSLNLASLIEEFKKVTEGKNIEGLQELLTRLKDLKDLRNPLCHGHWRTHERGAVLWCIRKGDDGEPTPFKGLISREDMDQMRDCAAEATKVVMSVVEKHTGRLFPGKGRKAALEQAKQKQRKRSPHTRG